MTFVVDASVALKWFVDEVHKEHADAVLRRNEPLLAPQHFRMELTSAVLKKIRAGDIDGGVVGELLAAIADAPVAEVATGSLFASAMDIALRFDRSIYDSLYVAVAFQEECRLVTADKKLHDAIAPTYPEKIIWIEDI